MSMIQNPPNGVVQLVNFTNDDQVTIKNSGLEVKLLRRHRFRLEEDTE